MRLIARRALSGLLVGAAIVFFVSLAVLHHTAPELPSASDGAATTSTSSRHAFLRAKLEAAAGHATRRLVQAERRLHAQLHADPAVVPVAAAPPCRDEHSQCAHWSSVGECEKNPVFMRNSCPVSCASCDDVRERARICHRTKSTRPLLRSGGIDATFQALQQQLSATHRVEVLSQPPTGPWVVVIDNFLTPHEIRAMIEKGGHKFERSLAGDGVSPVRTSKTSWCNVPFCEGDPVVQSIKRRVANVTGVPVANSEHVQVLKYEPGDFYRQHHDQNAHPHSPWGPRLFTFFTYLNDVEEGGGTKFNLLNLTVEPKPGRALMWPSVLDSDPSAVRRVSDHRTTHEALTVTKGQKLAANMWLHQYDFQNTLAHGCKNEDRAECGDCVEAQTDPSYR